MTTVWAVADSDSYLKWSSATLAALPAGWQRRQVLLSTPLLPTADQVRAAAGPGLRPWSLARLLAGLGRQRPDVLVLACTGPVVRALTQLPVVRSRRQVLVTGLPGIALPASRRVVEARAACDLLVVHSRRERAAYQDLARSVAPGLAVGLARLPFLAGDRRPAGRGADLVFAGQALVPPERAQRIRILQALAGIAPAGSSVVKLRGAAGEPQTHHEPHRYPDLWAELVAAGAVAPGAVRFVTGSMSAVLDRARALVTVSSTAALEAIAAGVPTAVLADFGVSDALLNGVFAGSGCLAGLDDVRAGRFTRPDPGWLAENYLHPPQDSDWTAVLGDLLRRRRGDRATGRPDRRPWPGGTARERVRATARLLLLPGAGLSRRGRR